VDTTAMTWLTQMTQERKHKHDILAQVIMNTSQITTVMICAADDQVYSSPSSATSPCVVVDTPACSHMFSVYSLQRNNTAVMNTLPSSSSL